MFSYKRLIDFIVAIKLKRPSTNVEDKITWSSDYQKINRSDATAYDLIPFGILETTNYVVFAKILNFIEINKTYSDMLNPLASTVSVLQR